MGTFCWVERPGRGPSELGPRQWIEHKAMEEISMEAYVFKGPF